jgi:hypothetical protein
MGRCLALVLAVAGLLALVPAPPARASDQWCEDDPLVVITTPGGAAVPLYVTKRGLGLEHLAAVQLGRVSYTALAAAGGGATLVQLAVTIPDDAFGVHFATQAVVSTGPLGAGTVYADASGFSGQGMPMQFILDVP